jgi:hypothetical protein
MSFLADFDKRSKQAKSNPKLKAMFENHLEVQSKVALAMTYSKLFTTEESNDVMALFNKIWDKKVKEVLAT